MSNLDKDIKVETFDLPDVKQEHAHEIVYVKEEMTNNPDDLNTHIQLKTMNPFRVKEPTKFMCKYCQKTYRRPKYYETHVTECRNAYKSIVEAPTSESRRRKREEEEKAEDFFRQEKSDRSVLLAKSAKKDKTVNNHEEGEEMCVNWLKPARGFATCPRESRYIVGRTSQSLEQQKTENKKKLLLGQPDSRRNIVQLVKTPSTRIVKQSRDSDSEEEEDMCLTLPIAPKQNVLKCVKLESETKGEAELGSATLDTEKLKGIEIKVEEPEEMLENSVDQDTHTDELNNVKQEPDADFDDQPTSSNNFDEKDEIIYKKGSTKPKILKCVGCGEEFNKTYLMFSHNKHCQLAGAVMKLQAKVKSSQPTSSDDGVQQPIKLYADEAQKKRNNRIICLECNEQHDTRTGYAKHKKDVHGKEELQCSFCPKIFKNWRALQDHHSIELKEFPCDICGRCFGRKFRMELHHTSCGL